MVHVHCNISRPGPSALLVKSEFLPYGRTNRHVAQQKLRKMNPLYMKTSQNCSSALKFTPGKI